MKVKLDVLQRVYESLQDRGDHTQVEREIVDPESHLFFIDAYEMPRWVWSQERGTFERYCQLNLYLLQLLLISCVEAMTSSRYLGPRSRE